MAFARHETVGCFLLVERLSNAYWHHVKTCSRTFLKGNDDLASGNFYYPHTLGMSSKFEVFLVIIGMRCSAQQKPKTL